MNAQSRAEVVLPSDSFAVLAKLEAFQGDSSIAVQPPDQDVKSACESAQKFLRECRSFVVVSFATQGYPEVNDIGTLPSCGKWTIRLSASRGSQAVGSSSGLGIATLVFAHVFNGLLTWAGERNALPEMAATGELEGSEVKVVGSVKEKAEILLHHPWKGSNRRWVFVPSDHKSEFASKLGNGPFEVLGVSKLDDVFARFARHVDGLLDARRGDKPKERNEAAPYPPGFRALFDPSGLQQRDTARNAQGKALDAAFRSLALLNWGLGEGKPSKALWLGAAAASAIGASAIAAVVVGSPRANRDETRDVASTSRLDTPLPVQAVDAPAPPANVEARTHIEGQEPRPSVPSPPTTNPQPRHVPPVTRPGGTRPMVDTGARPDASVSKQPEPPARSRHPGFVESDF